MSNVREAKPVLGRQTHLPLSRAFKISLNSLKIRFWRSTITAGGIFLGIAFFTTVLTQSLMQWPVPEKVDVGFVKVDGQVNGPGAIEVWKPVPIDEGLKAGIPADVITHITKTDDKTFRLATIAQGQTDAKRADKNLVRVNKEWESLQKISQPLTFYTDVFAAKDVKVADAVKAGVPEKVAKKLAGKAETLKGAELLEIIKKNPDWVTPFYAAVAQDLDISVNDAVKANVPEGIAKHLVGEGKAFKAAALAGAITEQPNWIKLWQSRAKRNAIYKTVGADAIKKLSKAYAITLDEALKEAKGPVKKTADMFNLMIVNSGGRKVSADLAKPKSTAGTTKLRDGDNVLLPDVNNRYRTLWLVIMSLLVCTVGITNSMLMAVTERFKEIGTMKCLGAMDKFVVTLFILESGMMGIVASVLGWLIGFLSIVLLAGFTRGWAVVGNISMSGMAGTFALAVSAGLIITMLATIAPALRAASMPAAMALRSEI